MTILLGPQPQDVEVQLIAGSDLSFSFQNTDGPFADDSAITMIISQDNGVDQTFTGVITADKCDFLIEAASVETLISFKPLRVKFTYSVAGAVTVFLLGRVNVK